MKYVRLFVPLVLLVAGVVFFSIRVSRENARKRQELLDLLAQHNMNAQNLYRLMQAAATNLQSMHETAQQQVRKAEEAVLAVTGSPFDRKMAQQYLALAPPPDIQEEKSEKPPVRESPEESPKPEDAEGVLNASQIEAIRNAQKDKPSASGGDASREKASSAPPSDGLLTAAQLESIRKAQAERRGVTAPSTNRPPGALPAPSIRPTAPSGEEEAPPGEMTRSQLDALRRRWGGEPLAEEGIQPADAPAAAAAKGIQDKPLSAPRMGSGPLRPSKTPAVRPPEIVILTAQVAAGANTVAEKAEASRTMLAAAEQAVANCRVARMPRESAPCVALLNEQYTLLRAYENEAQQILLSLGAPMQKIFAIHAKAEKEKEELHLALERRKKEEAHKKQVAEELAALAALRNKQEDLLKQYRYEEILKTLHAKEPELQTSEARSALRAQIERFAFLQELKAFVIRTLNGRPFKWGWGSGVTARDILGADEGGLRITGGTVPWPDVPLVQMTKIIEHCLNDAQLDRKVRSRQTLAYAILHLETGNRDAAQNRLKEIVEKYPTLEEEAKRLLGL